MKKTLIPLMGIVFCVLCTSCPHHFIYLDESDISGKLCYAVNPFDPEDTIICIKNVYISFTCHDQEYCSATRELLSQFEGTLTDCRFHQYDVNDHHWEFISSKEMCFYPTCNGQFISMIDSETGILADSINLLYRDVTIYKKQRAKENNDESKLYMGDFVFFLGSDYMKPKFITDSVTPIGEKIVCFDGHNGPSLTAPIELQK